MSYQPVWTPGGERLLYTIYGIGLVWRPYDKSSALAVVTHDPVFNPSSWSADGTLLLGGQDDLWALHLPDSVPTFLVETEGRESMPALSPDGRWLAYVSDRDGSDEIWVQAFDGEGGPWKVSEGGGWTPTWSASGDRLYFRTKTAIMASDVAAGPTFVWSSPTVVLASAYPQAGNSIWWEKSFDVFPDGERIVLYEQFGPSGYEVTYETRWVQRMLEDGNR